MNFQQWQPLSQTVDQFFRGAMAPALPPPRLRADVYESTDGDTFVVEIPVPGVKPEEITIEATSDTITVVTQPKPESEAERRRYLQREQPAGAMSRVIEFPEEIDTDNVKATLEYGILKLEVPKAAIGRRKVIKVMAAR
ncbi:MAG: Hsp20/alpha crystallin family protein [Chloroflexi bacterium]|nr:Hsp20/alpha crystallin family protein [Chloroflexota bacterium]